jgi:hypothetical protein
MYNLINLLYFLEQKLTVFLIYFIVFIFVSLMYNKEIINDSFLVFIFLYFIMFKVSKHYKNWIYVLCMFYSVNFEEMMKNLQEKKLEIVFFTTMVKNVIKNNDIFNYSFKWFISFFFFFFYIFFLFFNYININFFLFFFKFLMFIFLFFFIFVYIFFFNNIHNNIHKKTPNLFVYYPLISSVSSVIIRFMGIILLFPFIFSIVCLFINKNIFVFEICLFIVFFLSSFHSLFAIKHFLEKLKI